MLPIILPEEPEFFDADVRQKGLRYLANNPDAKASMLPRHWQGEPLAYLRAHFSNICNYSCFYIDPGTSDGTVDHFIPKTLNKQLAYEWSNYRFASIKTNRSKDDHIGVCDPAQIGHDWFQLDFTTMMIQVGEPPADAFELVTTTISTSGIDLNHEDLRKTRETVWELFSKGHVAAVFLERYYPFIYSEALRQGKL